MTKRRSKKSFKRKTYRKLKTSKRRNTRRKNTRRKNTRGKMRRKIMKGGADAGALQDQERLHSRVNLGFDDYSPETLEITVKNMRHKLGEYNLRDYGFQYLDMKSQLDQLTDLEDIDPERLKQISNLLKIKILENVLKGEQYDISDDTTFNVKNDRGLNKVGLFFVGGNIRGGGGQQKFPTVHCDFKITDSESYLSSLKVYSSLSMGEKISEIDELTTLKSDNYCLLNVWINLTEGVLIHNNLAFIDKKNVPVKQTSRYSIDRGPVTMFTRLIDDYDLGEAYTCGKLLQGEGYLFQSTWTPHFSLGKTVSTEDPEWATLHKYASAVHPALPARKIQSVFRGYSTRKKLKKMKGGSYSAVETWDQKRKSCEFRILLTMEDADVFERFMGIDHFEGDTIYEYHDLVKISQGIPLDESEAKLQELGEVKILQWLEIHQIFLPVPKDEKELKNNDELIQCLEELKRINKDETMAIIYSKFDEDDSKELIDSSGEINMISLRLVVKNLENIKKIFGDLSFLKKKEEEEDLSESESDEDDD